MLNNRDDKYENPEESEYHFSDEDVSYEEEAESELTKTAAVPEVKETFFTRLTRSKRMLIVLFIFLVLVYIVYKLVTPTTSVQTTDITSATTSSVAVERKPSPILSSPRPVTPVAVSNVVAVPTPAMTQPAPAVSQMPPAVSAVTQPSVAVPMIASVPTQTMQPVPTAPVMQQPPSMLPSTVPSMAGPVQVTIPVTAAPVSAAGVTGTTMAALTADSARLVAQVQSDYTQKLNDYAVQNKMLAEQVQALGAKVAVMENELNQLVQTLTRQNQAATAPAATAATLPQPDTEAKIGYSVQAIIPGRAWLRSDNGETITVAEGEMIKDVGRVIKIDPYDGTVEINMGNRTVSLSYGTNN